jgi:RNA polymerase-associated protein LEO1
MDVSKSKYCGPIGCDEQKREERKRRVLMSAAEDLFGSSDEESGEETVKGDEVKEGAAVMTEERGATTQEEEEAAAVVVSQRVDEDEVAAEVQRELTQTAQGEPIDIEAADLPAPDPRAEVYLLRLPATVPVVSTPFDAQLFSATAADSAEAIRWRYAADGHTRESNARLVRWSNGTTQLMVGSTAYDVFEHDAHAEHQHIFARFRGVVQGQGIVRARLVVQPHTARTAASAAAQLAAQSSSLTASAASSGLGMKRKVRLVDDGQEDPERALERLRRMEIERGRAEASAEARRRRREASLGGSLDPEMLEDGDAGAAALGAGGVGDTRGMLNEAEEREAEQRILQAKQPHKRTKH